MNVKLRVLSAGVLFFIGAQTLSAQKNGKDTIPTTKEIDEVVIVGYSAVPKDTYVGTASKVDVKSINAKSVSTVSQALAGEVAGVKVINTSGQPGTEGTIRIRGFGSVNGNRNPLYVVDGMPYLGNVSAINPDDIESMVVLKDATATSIYGARGANGVIVINTKKGKANKSVVQIESKVGFNMSLLPRYEVIKSPEEYIGLSWEALYNQGVINNKLNPNPAFNAVNYANARLFSNAGINNKYNMWGLTAANLIDPNTRQVRPGVGRRYDPENWEDYAFQTSVRTENNLTISGGSDKTTYYTNIGYLKDEGYSINSGYERYTGRLNVSHQAKPWLKGEFNLGYTYAKTKRNGQSTDSGSIFWFVDNIPSIYPLFLRNAQGGMVPDPYFGGNQYDYGQGRGFGALTNAIADATYDQNNRSKHEINVNSFWKADITKGLSFETRIGGQYYNQSDDQLNNQYYGSQASSNGYIYKEKNELMVYNWMQMLRYVRKFGDHGIHAFAAHESNTWELKTFNAGRANLIQMIPELNQGIGAIQASSYKEGYTLESYFGQFDYNYKSKYFLTGTVRRDGSSRFLNNKWGTFGSVGASWLASKEDFLADNKVISFLKVKASYGSVGDQAGVGFYPGYTVSVADNFYDTAGAPLLGRGYPALGWERTTTAQGGLELAFFKKKIIELNVDYYQKRTTDLIFNASTAPSTGNTFDKLNGGVLVNRGLEFDLKAHIINKDDFFVDFGLNGQLMKNKLTAMPIDIATGRDKIVDISGVYGRAVGHSVYDYYMRDWAGVNSATGAAQWTVNWVDRNGNGVMDDTENITSLADFMANNPGANILEGKTENYALATQKFIGKSAIPDISGGFNLSVGYKAFELSAQFLYSMGGYGYDSAYAGLMHNNQVGKNNWSTDILNRWQNPGDVTDVPRLTSNRSGDTQYNSTSSRFLTKSDYLALNNVRLAYNLSQDYIKSIGLTGLTLYVSGDNLWIGSKRKGYNPSVSETGGSSQYTYNPLSTITFGAKINF